LILQGFIPPTGIAKTPFSRYNISYFLLAIFRTGKYPVTAQFSAAGRAGCKTRAASSRSGFVLWRRWFGAGAGRLLQRWLLGPPGRGKLYRKGLSDGNFRAS
jgi:hypothetical protein